MSASAKSYAALLEEAQPEAIHDAAQNRQYVSTLTALLLKDSRTEAEEKLLELYRVLIGEYESREFRLPSMPPAELLSHLMEEHGLKQKDMLDIFGYPSVVSEVLSGKRTITKDQAVQLGQRFRMSPVAFISLE